MGHTYNPSTEEAEAGDEEFRSFSATQRNQGYMTSYGMKKGREGGEGENGRKGGEGGMTGREGRMAGREEEGRSRNLKLALED